MRGEGCEHAVGVAEQERARDDVVAVAQEREHDRSDRCHAGREACARDALLHAIEFMLEGGGGRVALAAIGESLRAALEDGRELARVFIGVGDR